ncbi:hypothetical protein [Nocardioides sp. AN3]
MRASGGRFEDLFDIFDDGRRETSQPDSGTRRYTAAEAAVEIDCSAWFIKKIARENGIGYNLRGPKGLPVP